ncbi:MAG: polyprenyl synthetase family protein [Actinomycetota bacterium]|nr:polyprenyl synthetase family protein [Actinomycetota bacterium]
MEPAAYDGAISVPPEPPGARAPTSLLDIAHKVEARVAALLDEETLRWAAIDPDLADLVESLADLVDAGGKRLRPAFCHWAYVGAGGDGGDPVVVDVGAAFELLHAFALVHDDIMDGSDQRRGRPTAHITYAVRHQREGWRGESRRFGEGVAILVGDLAFVYADMLMAAAPAAARAVYDELRVELNIGQYLDVLGTARGRANLDTARRITSYKSGKYTVERPLHVGAALAGRLEELAGPLSEYGLPLGEAFQLRDDLLGAFGDVTSTGKPVGDDLREGKPTPLMAIAVQRATGAAAARLRRAGDPQLSDAEVAGLQEVLVDTGAREEIERAIERLTNEAVDAVKASPLAEEAQVALAELAVYVAWRDR